MPSQFQSISPINCCCQFRLQLRHLRQLSSQKFLSKAVFCLTAKQIDRAVYYFLEGDLAFSLWIRDLVLRILACLTGI